MTDQKLQRAAWRWELRYLCQLGAYSKLTTVQMTRIERLLRLLKVGPETQLTKLAWHTLGWSR